MAACSGQLGLIPDEDDAEYRPSPEDRREFQAQLQEVLAERFLVVYDAARRVVPE